MRPTFLVVVRNLLLLEQSKVQYIVACNWPIKKFRRDSIGLELDAEHLGVDEVGLTRKRDVNLRVNFDNFSARHHKRKIVLTKKGVCIGDCNQSLYA